MKELRGRTVTRSVRAVYKGILAQGRQGVKEILRNEHLIRSCCINIINARNEFSQCPKNESGRLSVMEDLRDFCEISDYAFSEENIATFFRKLAARRNLTYGEIACLIPGMEYLCLLQLCRSSKETAVSTILLSLSSLHAFDCSTLAADLSKTEDVLMRDDIFPRLDKESKSMYRRKLRQLARKKKKGERDTAVELLKEARRTHSQIGGRLIRERKNRFYFPTLYLCWGAALFCVLIISKSIVLTVLSLIPAFFAGKLICDTLFSRLVSPQLMPKLKVSEAHCPVSYLTIVSLISTSSDVEKLLHRLDLLAHRIPLENIRVGLLLDFPASKQQLSQDEQQILKEITREIELRNKKCLRFFCAVRGRQWNSDEYRYEAFGRKQGAVMDFCDLCAGDDSQFSLACGVIDGGNYMILLDADTEPTLESVEGLIGFMEHPNHTPSVETDARGNRRVVHGYGAAAPRVEANPGTSFSTFFSSLIAGDAGTEFYHDAHFNLYQDLFSEGIFCGKGILRIDLYRELISSRFRSDPLLSHDLPEGEILRCATLSDLVFFDEIPHTVPADEKRTHRWIRGDYQNAAFLLPSRGASTLFRQKVLQNLLRPLSSVALFFLIIASLFVQQNGLILALFWIAFPSLLRIPSFLRSVFGPIRCYRPFRPFFRSVAEAFFNLTLLPTRAVNALDGAIRGTVRLLRGKKKLEWVTAADSNQASHRAGEYFYRLRWQQLGFLFLFFPITLPLGILWMIGPEIARICSAPYRKASVPKEVLKDDLSAMWQYFSDFMNEKNHWLPPDNYQQEPLNVVAPRTSPTNIGLGLLSVLGAYDLSLISKEELYDRIGKTLTTLESLSTWKGHLYNWYDTQSLKVLSPKFVSTVDSGNYAASMLTLAKGLRELEEAPALQLAQRIETHLDAMDFSALYDARKRLFSIGFDVSENRLSASYYDLYASEARLTSYYAIMKQQVPPEHWNALARPARGYRGFLSISSWSGTMFEYFMPHLFLPAFQNTLSGEMLRGALFAQMHHGGKDIPWGISESCYYEFDSLLNYQYRAFGISDFALRRDLSFPSVISPYSTFLAYPWFPVRSEKNRSRLPKGKYGYFEAIDYRAGSANPRVVQCFMAHHIGMSFLSGVNYLTENRMHRRFLTGEGEAYLSLLTEAIPAYSRRDFHIQTELPERWYPTEIRIDRPDPEHPKVHLLSNGLLTDVMTDSGSGVLFSNGSDLTKYSADPNSPEGVFCFLRHKGTLYGATYAPLYENHGYRMFFDRHGTTCYGTFDGFETRLSSTLVPGQPVAVKELTVKNNLMTESSFEFILFLNPVLRDRRSYEAHPEYEDLFLTADYDPSLRIVSFCRKTNGRELWFSVSASEPVRYDVRRDSFASLAEIANGRFEGIASHPIFPTLVFKGVLEVRGRGTGVVRFYCSTGKTKEDALRGIRAAAPQSFETVRRRYEQAFDSLCIASEIRSADRMVFNQIASAMLYPPVRTASETKITNTLPVSALWKYGISGDVPILAIRIGADSISRIAPFLKSMFLMHYAGIPMDLVFVYREKEEYNTPLKTAIASAISELKDSLRSRVYSANVQTVDEYLLIQKASTLFINLERGWKLKNPHRTFRPILSSGTAHLPEKSAFALGRGAYTSAGSFRIAKQGSPNFRPWSLVLANQRIGTVLNERSLGYTFAGNASERQITRRIPGNVYAGAGEHLYAVIHGKRYDLLAGAGVEYFRHGAIYRIELFHNVIETELFIPTSLPVKILRVSVSELSDELSEIVYEPNVTMGSGAKNTVNRRFEGNAVFYSNPYRPSFGEGHTVLFGIRCEADGDRLRFRPTTDTKTGYFMLGYGSGYHSAQTLPAILTASRVEKERKKAKNAWENWIRIDTPDAELNYFVNGFLQQQIRSSRILGRTGPSQPGGAYGFRDQLQDTINLAMFQPSYLRRQILRCCMHQFEEGDVLHWWHPRQGGGDDGIRTRFSDDPFWLAFACTEYYSITEDRSLFCRTVPWLTAPGLSEEERDRYFTPEKTSFRASVYEHAMQALRYGMKPGKHGLILFGSGDWNDGMNGLAPGAETVWGSMFALLCVQRFQILASVFDRNDDEAQLKQWESDLRNALNEHAFGNGRFLRGYDSLGTPIGGEALIDLIPQAFSVFCGMDPDSVDSALDAAYSRLWDEERKIIRLLDPPYRRDDADSPGTIADYPSGIRENGGQYTHAGVWFSRALFHAGNRERAWTVLSAINPVGHCRTPAGAHRYGLEPYVMAADVSTLPGREGLGGWSHYTGAAGWYLRTVVEDLLGIRRNGNRIYVTPAIPSRWNGYRAQIHVESDVISIRVERGTEIGMYEEEKKVNGILLTGGSHNVTVIV